MATTGGKLKLVISSEKMERIVEYEVPLMTYYGKVGTTRRRARVYDYVFDERQKRVLDEAKELAIRSGLTLEVTDLSRQGTLRRILSLGLRKTSGESGARLAPSSGSKTTPAETQEGREVIISPVSRP